jgi:hypothetical protein
LNQRNQGGMDKKRSLDYIRRRNTLSPIQGKVTQVNIMLRTSSIKKDEKQQKEESS